MKVTFDIVREIGLALPNVGGHDVRFACAEGGREPFDVPGY
jgi:hypothetical protein